MRVRSAGRAAHLQPGLLDGGVHLRGGPRARQAVAELHVLLGLDVFRVCRIVCIGQALHTAAPLSAQAAMA